MEDISELNKIEGAMNICASWSEGVSLLLYYSTGCLKFILCNNNSSSGAICVVIVMHFFDIVKH